MFHHRQFILPIILLLIFVWLTRAKPGWAWLWGFLFLLSTSTLFLFAIFKNFMLLDRLYRGKHYQKLVRISEPVWSKRTKGTLKQINGIYLAAALAALGDEESVKRARDVLEAIPIDKLPVRFRNRLLLVEAQLLLYEEKYHEAIICLKKATLEALGIFYLARLFHIFSIAFVSTHQELERAYHYAAKAFEFFPKEPVYKAQFGLSHYHYKGGAEGKALLKEATEEISQRKPSVGAHLLS